VRSKGVRMVPKVRSSAFFALPPFLRNLLAALLRTLLLLLLRTLLPSDLKQATFLRNHLICRFF
jgi:hypothetical protein